MKVKGNHHVAIRVADCESSAKFYEKTLGARRLMPPFTLEGEDAQRTVAGPEGSKLRILPIDFDGGGAIELYEFEKPSCPPDRIAPWEANLMHLAFEVEDVKATLEAVEANGGERMWPEVVTEDELEVIFVYDPDGNVLELMNLPMDGLVEVLKRLF